jgi:hypothetical protein
MISNKTKTEDANKEFDTLRHEIIADAKDNVSLIFNITNESLEPLWS